MSYTNKQKETNGNYVHTIINIKSGEYWQDKKQNGNYSHNLGYQVGGQDRKEIVEMKHGIQKKMKPRKEKKIILNALHTHTQKINMN